MPADLVGKCFNCLCLGHVAADCPNPVRCLRCHREGHHAQCYKCSGPPEATGPPRPQKLASVVVLIPAKGDIALAEPSRSRASTRPSQHGLSTPLNMDQASMLEGSPSRHILPSPPPESPPYLQGSPLSPSPPPSGPSGAVECPRHFELHVIPCTQAMNEAEAVLANALVVMVGGARPVISPEQIRQHLLQFYGIAERDVQVKRYSCADFLLIFTSRLLADSVLHALPPATASRLSSCLSTLELSSQSTLQALPLQGAGIDHQCPCACLVRGDHSGNCGIILLGLCGCPSIAQSI
jgi:hypothetical protein